MKTLIAAALLGASLLAGCATSPSQKEIASANYGPAPTTAQLEQALVIYRDAEPDPASVRYRDKGVSALKEGWERDEQGHTQYGWTYDFEVKSKTKDGVETPWVPRRAFFINGRQIRVVDGNNRRIPMDFQLDRQQAK